MSSTTSTTPDAAIYKWADKTDGEFKRQVSSFRDWIGSERFPAEKGRYHLYVSLACPWAHRTLIVRALKGLQDVIGVTVVDYLMGPNGWHFSTPEETPGCSLDPYHNAKHVRDIYFKAEPTYSGRFTVPVLWDTKLHTIVNNESSEIIRMLNKEFNQWSSHPALDLYPEELAPVIDEINEWIYNDINNGVYKSGFATKQEAYEKNVHILFNSLDRVEAHLEGKTWLIGEKLTEADVRLFTTIIRFDPVYHGHFKCNLKSISANYPNLLKHTRRLYQVAGVADTVDMTHIKRHYYMSHLQINPTQVVSAWNGPDLANPKVESNVFAQ
ncbi:unnamed protein product [Aphanomyces euteiches]|uniref:GST C-terminal domain-containing protein n=1 Tax=Aphanomyces euteiches TaxID=100861 RepID=A0A6G0WAC9_9STRA|nr:hypothetical protein Ae201684_017083 [Aphanomyces euteiches]KAH9094204.1 hypothetical protein Ae201684P_016816 [Aphanomyces euteiches]KAH9131626.1 hypothetical protein AeRB84_021723 [Aphanomyces euteiches]